MTLLKRNRPGAQEIYSTEKGTSKWPHRKLAWTLEITKMHCCRVLSLAFPPKSPNVWRHFRLAFSPTILKQFAKTHLVFNVRTIILECPRWFAFSIWLAWRMDNNCNTKFVLSWRQWRCIQPQHRRSTSPSQWKFCISLIIFWIWLLTLLHTFLNLLLEDLFLVSDYM